MKFIKLTICLFVFTGLTSCQRFTNIYLINTTNEVFTVKLTVNEVKMGIEYYDFINNKNTNKIITEYTAWLYDVSKENEEIKIKVEKNNENELVFILKPKTKVLLDRVNGLEEVEDCRYDIIKLLKEGDSDNIGVVIDRKYIRNIFARPKKYFGIFNSANELELLLK